MSCRGSKNAPWHRFSKFLESYQNNILTFGVLMMVVDCAVRHTGPTYFIGVQLGWDLSVKAV